MTIVKGTFQSYVKDLFEGIQLLCTLHFFGALPSLRKEGPRLYGPHIWFRINSPEIFIYRLVMDYSRWHIHLFMLSSFFFTILFPSGLTINFSEVTSA